MDLQPVPIAPLLYLFVLKSKPKRGPTRVGPIANGGAIWIGLPEKWATDYVRVAVGPHHAFPPRSKVSLHLLCILY